MRAAPPPITMTAAATPTTIATIVPVSLPLSSLVPPPGLVGAAVMVAPVPPELVGAVVGPLEEPLPLGAQPSTQQMSQVALAPGWPPLPVPITTSTLGVATV